MNATLPADQALAQANYLARQNRLEHDQTSTWRIFRRRRLDREWHDLARYRLMAMVVMERNEREQQS